jgi:hypothetical protein
MPHTFELTPLWQRTLGAHPSDGPRDQLRSAYLQFRATVEPLAGEISVSMPMFTDHSIVHVDSLPVPRACLTATRSTTGLPGGRRS